MPPDPSPAQIYQLMTAVFQPSGDTKPGLKILGGTGVPAVTLGDTNMYYLRFDGVGANTHLYHKEAGVWVGVC